MKELTQEEKMLGLKEPNALGQEVSRAVISVLGEDRVGIIAAISQVLAEQKANIAQINQNILEGLFAMIMIVEMNKVADDFDQFKQAVESKGPELGVKVTVQSENVFRYMHRI